MNVIGFVVNVEMFEFEIKKEIVELKEIYKVGEIIMYCVLLKNIKVDFEVINLVLKDVLDGCLNYLLGFLKIISGLNFGEKMDVLGDD